MGDLMVVALDVNSSPDFITEASFKLAFFLGK